LHRRFEALCISADDGNIGSGVGENGRDLNADAREAPVTRALLP